MVGVHVAPEAGAVTVHVLVPIVGDPESVMRMPDWPAVDVMAVAGVNVTDAVVTTPLAWEPRVTASPEMAPAFDPVRQPKKTIANTIGDLIMAILIGNEKVSGS